MEIRPIVLTGGPCAGKTTILAVLEREFSGQVLVVPEVATGLLESLLPVPGRHLEWTPEWQRLFQEAIFGVQGNHEALWALVAEARGIPIQMCDRGFLDIAAYLEGGVEEFCNVFEVSNVARFRARYEAIVHLESLATGMPEEYERQRHTNPSRFEPVELAQKRELALREAWQEHPQWTFLSCVGGLEGKIRAVCQIMRDFIVRSR